MKKTSHVESKVGTKLRGIEGLRKQASEEDGRTTVSMAVDGLEKALEVASSDLSMVENRFNDVMSPTPEIDPKDGPDHGDDSPISIRLQNITYLVGGLSIRLREMLSRANV